MTQKRPDPATPLPAHGAPVPTDAPPRFRTPPGVVQLQLALSSGHIALLTEQPRELPPLFHAEARRYGCLSEADIAALQDSLQPAAAPDRMERICSEVEALLQQADKQLLDSQGRPHLAILSDRLGFSITPAERDAALALVA